MPIGQACRLSTDSTVNAAAFPCMSADDTWALRGRLQPAVLVSTVLRATRSPCASCPSPRFRGGGPGRGPFFLEFRRLTGCAEGLITLLGHRPIDERTAESGRRRSAQGARPAATGPEADLDLSPVNDRSRLRCEHLKLGSQTLRLPRGNLRQQGQPGHRNIQAHSPYGYIGSMCCALTRENAFLHCPSADPYRSLSWQHPRPPVDELGVGASTLYHSQQRRKLDSISEDNRVLEA